MQGVEPHGWNPLQLLASCVTVSSLSGLAAILRSKQQLTWRNVIAAMLYSGMFGLAYSMLWLSWFNGDCQNVYFVVGSSAFVGLGGTSALDFVLTGIKEGFNVKISAGAEGSDQSHE